MEEVVSQQISAAIEALSHAKAKLSTGDVGQHVNSAASFLNDIQFNILFLNSGLKSGRA